jgi:N-acetylmuramoyl-L-alanine amidase
MAVINYTQKQLKLLARLMRAEAVSDGRLAMLMVGNTGVNRVRVDCLDFKGIRNLQDMVFQQPGGFEATQKGFFYQRARDKDIRLARKTVKGQRYHPATYSLWFFAPEGNCPQEWFGEPLEGRYKTHCFYKPTWNECKQVF